MSKTGRNETCPCGSGRKHKHCCLGRPQGTKAAPPLTQSSRISLLEEIAAVQDAACSRRPLLREIGLFILFSSEDGDAWLLEASEMDALRLAQGGERCPVPVGETEDVLEIDWGYRVVVEKTGLRFFPHEEQPPATAPLAPVGRIHAALRRIRNRVPQQVLRAVHMVPSSLSSTA